MIFIAPYTPTWQTEFTNIQTELAQLVGDLAVSIDHIGSTSVVELPAKDLIDIQMTVPALLPQLRQRLLNAGWQQSPHKKDHIPPRGNPDPQQWEKWLFKSVPPTRPINLHVRIQGRANQRYALLFRDYLRQHPAIAEAYGQVKNAIVKYHPEDDMDAYYDIKDPVCDIIMGGAEQWAKITNWDVFI